MGSGVGRVVAGVYAMLGGDSHDVSVAVGAFKSGTREEEKPNEKADERVKYIGISSWRMAWLVTP